MVVKSTSLSPKLANFNWEDPFLLNDMLTDEERMIQSSVRAYAEGKLMPRILQDARNETFDREIITEAGQLGLLGGTIEGYGCPGINYVSYGLMARELEKIDSSYRSIMSVQSSL